MALLPPLFYHTFVFLTLFSYGLYHLLLSTRSFFKSPTHSPHTPRLHHPLPFPPTSTTPRLLRRLPTLLSLLSLLISISQHLATPSPSSLHTAASLSLFPFLLLLSPSLPPELSFLLSSLAFLLLSLSPSPSPSPSLQPLAHSISSSISAASAAFAFILSLFPRLFPFELALAASVSLQGLWSLQTGLSLYVDRFVPEGCHRLLGVSEATTSCDLETSRVRAGQILDLALAVQAVFVAVVVVGVYVGVGKACGGGGDKGLGSGRRFNGGGPAYEALPTAGSGGGGEMGEHVQMKAIVGKSSAQA